MGRCRRPSAVSGRLYRGGWSPEDRRCPSERSDRVPDRSRGRAEARIWDPDGGTRAHHGRAPCLCNPSSRPSLASIDRIPNRRRCERRWASNDPRVRPRPPSPSSRPAMERACAGRRWFRSDEQVPYCPHGAIKFLDRADSRLLSRRSRVKAHRSALNLVLRAGGSGRSHRRRSSDPR